MYLTKSKGLVSFWDSIGCLTFNEKNKILFKTESSHLFNIDPYILIHLNYFERFCQLVSFENSLTKVNQLNKVFKIVDNVHSVDCRMFFRFLKRHGPSI